MSGSTGERDDLGQLRQALSSMRELRSRLQTVEAEAREPIAVVGLGCRFPGGAGSPEAFWTLLREGADLVTEVPPSRWAADGLYASDPAQPGRMNTKWGAFVEPVDLFDAAFFGISPVEAARMDPQQRLLLETAFEALEDAGHPLERWAGQNVGVFIGAHSHSSDYYLLQARDLADLGTHTSTGTAHSTLANRLSYTFDWRGPSLSVDTACSSSLVAVHLAVQSLRRRECDLAIAGGVNLVLAPEMSVALSKLGMMAPDGRCKTFDSRADGFVRGEGCGVVALRRLSDARAGEDPILALIAGSAVNQDGTTNGLTAPNGLSQEDVLRHALDDARVSPEEVGFVEAHGTGTTLGDPIEVEALGNVLGRAGDRPCLLGSVKTNLGHLEAAAGIAGMIKAVLALRHGEIPPNLHFRELNPHIALAGTRLRIRSEGGAWPEAVEAPGARVAGVSSFGFGGTNAHVVLRSAPAPAAEMSETPRAPMEGPGLVPLSARDGKALRELGERWADFSDSTSESFRDVSHTAATRRTHHDHRVALVAASMGELRERIESYLADEGDPGVAQGRARSRGGAGPVFVFSGQGAQWTGMARDLLEGEPAFREPIEACDAVYGELSGGSLVAELLAEGGASRLERTEVAQPVIVALQVALAALLDHWGVRPEAVVGHSVGEIAAAHVAGVLSLEDAMRIAIVRGRLMEKTPGRGRMASIALSADEARSRVAGPGSGIEIAAVNAPGWTVISGDTDRVEAAVAELGAGGTICRPLPVEYAFHSAHMDPCREELVRALDGIRVSAARIPIHSTVRGGPAAPADFDPAYWGRNLRDPVRFGPAIGDLIAAGHTHFVELGPHPVLCAMITASSREGGERITALPSLRRGLPGRTTLLGAIGRLWAEGYEVDWRALHPEGGRAVELPRYPWQRRRHWFTPGEEGRALPLPGRRIHSPVPSFEMSVARDLASFTHGHRIAGLPVLPAAAFLAMALRGMEISGRGTGAKSLSDLVFHEPLLGGREGEGRVVHLVFQEERGGRSGFAVHSSPAESDASESGGKVSGGWTLHFEGRLEDPGAEAAARDDEERDDPAAIRERASDEFDGGAWRSRLEARGVDLSGAFGTVDHVWRGRDEALVLVRISPAVGSRDAHARGLRESEGESGGAGARGGGPEVTILDAALQACLALTTEADPGASQEGALRIVAGIDRVRLEGDVLRDGGTPDLSRLWCHARRRGDGADGRGAERVDVLVRDAALGPVARMEGVVLRPADGRSFVSPPLRAPDDWFLDLVWEECRGPGRREPGALRALEELAAAYARRAVATVGGAEGETPERRRYLRRLLDLGEGLDGAAPPSGADLSLRAEELIGRHPDHEVAIRILARCGGALPGVLRGETDPLALLFGADPSVEELYRDAPSSRREGARVAEMVAAAAERVPPSRPVRVLELGAGTGGTTEHILGRLPGNRTEYLFTDLSAALVRASAERFADRDFMRFEVVDVEAMELPRAHFDVIVAANVLHATRDVERTLRDVRELLAPGGILVLLETTAPRAWVDVVFGMTEGWWRFADVDVRPHHPLLPVERWLDVLENAGYEAPFAAGDRAPSGSPNGCGVTGDSAGEDEVLPQAVVVAAAPGADGSLLPRSGRVSERWGILSRGSPLAEAVARELEASGRGAVMLEEAGRVRRGAASGEAVSGARPGGPLHLRRVVDLRAAELEAAGGSDEGGDVEDLEAAKVGREITEAVLAPARTLSRLAALAGKAREGAGPSFQLATLGAHDLDEAGASSGPPMLRLLQGPVVAMGRCLAFQYPDLWGGQVDLDPGAGAQENAASLVAALTAEGIEDEVAVRAGRWHVPRMVGDLPRASGELRLDPEATYLVTGGLGGLGRRLALRLVERGARSLVLTGRRSLAQGRGAGMGGRRDERSALLSELAERGVEVRYEPVDAADPVAMEALISGIRNGPRPLRGVIHAAADISPRPLPELDRDSVGAIVNGKAAGAWLLHRQTRDLHLDFFVLFSSITATLGSRDLAHYAAANRFLEALARFRSASGLPALVVAWGTWDVRDALPEARRDEAERSGMGAMASSAALDALERLLAAGTASATVAKFHGPRLRRVFESRRRSGLLSRVEGAQAPVRETPPPAAESLRDLLARELPSERRSAMIGLVAGLARRVLGLGPSDDLDPERGFFELGMDSLMTVQLRDRLERQAGETLPAMLTLNYPNVEAVAGYLLERFGEGDSAEMAAQESAEELRDDVGGLSDEESRRLLMEELQALEDLDEG